jgi:hypothetical protein
MNKLRHIHSKVGSETAFRIPVSVEDAIAEAVEAYDLMRMAAEAEAKRGDELAAHVDRLREELNITTGLIREVCDVANVPAPAASLARADAALKETPVQSAALIQAKALRDAADKLTFHNIDDCSYYKGYDHAILDVRAAADALEGESDD